MRHRSPFMVVIAPAVLVPELMRITDEDQPQLRFTPQLGGFYCIVVVIKALNKDHAFALLEKMNFPFIKKGDN